MGIIDYIKGIISNDKKTAQIYAIAFEKNYNEKKALEIGLYDGKQPITDTDVTIKINGVPYQRKTDKDGIAKLNINLEVGTYDATIDFKNDQYNEVTA